MCFFRLHLEHPFPQILALFELPGVRAAPSGDPGLDHLLLRSSSVQDLFEHYHRLKQYEIKPHRCVDHGPTTSLYYRDPDQNMIEVAASNPATAEGYLAALSTEEYARNPAGKAIDSDARFAIARPPAVAS